jgi:prepilin-type N-terminal cleavage/methylation domain-containing protein
MRNLKISFFGKSLRKGFSLIEILLVAVAMAVLCAGVYGVVSGLKPATDTARSIQQAHVLNAAMTQYFMEDSDAVATWSAGTDSTKYVLLRTFIPQAPTNFTGASSFTPVGYTFSFPATLSLQSSVTITTPAGVVLVAPYQ